MSRLERHLVIFAKLPRMGRVKSRLARDIGTLAAWQFYTNTLYDVIHKLAPRQQSPLPWKTWLALTPDGANLPPQYPNTPTLNQGPGDLGHRMGRVLQNMPPGPVIIIGTDIPEISKHHINNAFTALDTQDSVLGPALDGGYWMVGLKRRPRCQLNAARHIFQNVRWSTENALKDTQANMQKIGLSTAIMDQLEDVDDKASLERWQEKKRSIGAR